MVSETEGQGRGVLNPFTTETQEGVFPWKLEWTGGSNMNLIFLIVQALSGIKRECPLKGFHIYPKEKG